MPCREACIGHAQQHPGDQGDGAPVRFLGKYPGTMRGDTLVDHGADFDASWVHDFGCEVPHIFLTLRIDTCLGGAFLDRCGRIGGDWDCGYKACVCVTYFILTWML